MKNVIARCLLCSALLPLVASTALAWDYEGHRLVNSLALATLPTNFPAFVFTPANSERVKFLAGEPDRWRNTPDLDLQHCQEPEHFMDLEELAQYNLKADALPPLRYDYIASLGAFRQAHPEAMALIESDDKDPAHKHRWVGLLPWAATEDYSKLKSGFSYLKTFEENGGTPEEIANAQANILYIMGVMGHYIGDAAQPLHSTIHHHGWVGTNANNYSTRSGIHSFIDGYFKKNAEETLKKLQPKLRPAQLVQIDGRPAKPEEMFQAIALYLTAQHQLVEQLYILDKNDKFALDPERGKEGREFLEGQMIKAGQMLGDIYYSAWQQAPPDTFLKSTLARRKLPADDDKK